jgi:hypothetical protein
MQRSTARLVFFLLLVAVQSGCIPFGDAWVNFSGHVKDIQGKPIEGAQIKILFNSKVHGERSETQTDHNGEYKIFENSCPCDFEFVVVAAKDGYKIYTKTMRGKEANNLKNLEIVLEQQ